MESLRTALGFLERGKPAEARQALAAAATDSSPSASQRSLLLHLEGQLNFELGFAEAFAAAFEQAASIEREAGWVVGSQHTIHQWSLLSAGDGASSRAGSYYKETFRSLRASRNFQGAGLCLRSLGELAAASGRLKECSTFWRSSERMLSQVAARESEQLRGWLEVIDRSTGVLWGERPHL